MYMMMTRLLSIEWIEMLLRCEIPFNYIIRLYKETILLVALLKD